MALFNSIPAVSTQKDSTKPINRKPSNKVTKEDLEIKKPLTDKEEDEILRGVIKEFDEEPVEPLYIEEDEEPKKEETKPVVKETSKKEEPKEAPKKESKPVQKVVLKPEVKEAPKKEEPKPEIKKEAKTALKEEPKKDTTPKVEEPKVEKVKEEVKPVEENRPLTPEEKKARQMENLRKARLARQQQQEKETDNMADKTKTQAEKPKKLVAEPKKAVDMSKMVMTTKKPQASTSSKTVYHVSKRGETREDRVWKVFIQESNKVIKLFDYQEEALEYAKQLAKNKNDGSYVILHGLNGKIRKY